MCIVVVNPIEASRAQQMCPWHWARGATLFDLVVPQAIRDWLHLQAAKVKKVICLP